MLSNNQRHFRKEFNIIQKDAAKGRSDPYYSYVKDEVITDYYAGQPNKKAGRIFKA